MAAAWGFLIQRSKAHGLPGIAQYLKRWGADGEAEIMNARIAIQQIIARALAHRDLNPPGISHEPDASDKLNKEGSQLIVSRKLQRPRRSNKPHQPVVTRT